MHQQSRKTARRIITLVTAGALAGFGLTLGGGTGALPVAAHRDQTTTLTPAQDTVIKQATRQFKDLDAAVAAGYMPTDECVPGMGYHYVHPGLAADLNVDPTLPEILVYIPTPDGGRRLGAIEYFRADLDHDTATDSDRPTLFGHGFDGPMDGHAPGMPIHYDLHVWLYRSNPAGELIADNASVVCP